MARLLVLMSTYNGQDYIEPQIISIMDQETSHEITLRIRDDGSKDATCQIIENLISRYPGRIELIRGTNLGSNASFFELIDIADSFDYYAISDQDDVCLPEKYETACNALEKEDNSIPLLFSSTSYLVKNDLVPYGETRKKEREFTIYNTVIQNICPGHNQVFNTALLTLLKKVKEPDRIYVYDMWIANTAMLYGKILFSNHSLTYYRQHEGNLMGTSESRLGKLMISFKRLMSGDGEKTRKQIQYFLEENEEKLKEEGFYDEIYSFLNSRSFFKRLVYVCRSKLYRQTGLETASFRFAVLSGKY